MAKRAPGSQSAGYHYNATPKKPAPTKTPTVAPPPSEAAKGPAGDYRGASADYVTAVEALPPKAQAVTEKATLRASRKRVRAQRAKVRALTKPKPPKAKNALKRVKAPKPYKAPKLPSTKPVKFQGKVTAGTPSLGELKSARVAGELKINKAGAVTTPKIRRVSRQVNRLRVKARKSKAPLPGLTPGESRNARVVLNKGRVAKASKKEMLAAAETGLVESSFKNLPTSLSDGTSAGWRQATEQERYGPESRRRKPGPTAEDFFHETATAGRGRGQTAGQLAQTVQGSAYPERYDQRKPEASAILHAYDKGGLKPPQAKKLKVAEAKASKLGLAVAKPHGHQINYLKTFGKQVGKELKLVKAGKLSSGPGKIVQDSGVSISEGHEPEIVARLKLLSAKIGKPIYIISGYRSPQHSVEVGGFANDPHTKGEAADIGVGSPSLESAGSISEAQYESVGLHRPFYPESAHEINHVQLLNGGTPATGSSSGSTTAGSLSSGAIAAYASASGSSPAAVRKALKTKKLTAAQIFKKLERLGVGVSNPTVTQTKARGTAPPTSELSRLEAKYGAAA